MITALIKKPLILMTVLIMVIVGNTLAQSSLDIYIKNGIENNLVLQQKNISLAKALNSLRIAKGLFFPSIDIKGDYQSGDGGRSIAIPLGDMLNPVYGTLNQLTHSNSFPQLDNLETDFFPHNFYDVKVRTMVPVMNSSLIYNRQIQKHQLILQEYEVEIYKIELIKNIKVAYYNYLSAAKSISIYDDAITLAREGKRVNESLLRNGKSLKAYVLRSESEIRNLDAKKVSALEQLKNAQMYFNFLINADANQKIDTSNVPFVDQKILDQYLLNETSITKRSELKALDQTTAIYENIVKMNKTFWLPKVNGYLDLGSQMTDWKFNDQSKYYFGGVQLEIPLFATGNNSIKLKQSQLDLKNHLLQKTFVNKQLQLSAEMAKNSLQTSYEEYLSSLRQLDAAEAYNTLIDKGYKEGSNSFIETIDARNQLTTGSLQVVINKYQLMAAIAIYEREINN